MDTQTHDLPVTALVLYAVTVAIELVVVCWRAFLLLVVVAIPFAVAGFHPGLALIVLLAFAPTVWSLLALSRMVGFVGTGWWWRTRVGGRGPSQREQIAYQQAVQLLQGHAGHELRLPTDWFVLDLPEPEAAVCGQTLMLSTGMLENRHLAAVLAHELGHIATWDARITAAINRLVIHPLRERHPDQERYQQQTGVLLVDDQITQTFFVIALLAWAIRTSLKWCRGGIGLWILRPFWGRQWRTSEYQADQYAAALGQADDLADFLETHSLAYDQPVPFTWLTAHTHPPAEHRIDKLRNHTPAPTVGNLGRPTPQSPHGELPGLERIPT